MQYSMTGILTLFALCGTADANEWIVGPGGFPDLQSAYAAASSGDTLRIRVARTSLFQLAGKGMIIVGDLPAGRPVLVATGLVGSDARIYGIPFGESLLMSGVDVDFDCIAAGPSSVRCLRGLSIDACMGEMIFHDVRFRGRLSSAPSVRATRLYDESVVVEDCPNVHFFDCALSGQVGFVYLDAACTTWFCGRADAGLSVRRSAVSLQRCRLYGGIESDPWMGCSNGWQQGAGSGLEAEGSMVSAHNTSLEGGGNQGLGGWSYAGGDLLTYSSHLAPFQVMGVGVFAPLWQSESARDGRRRAPDRFTSASAPCAFVVREWEPTHHPRKRWHAAGSSVLVVYDPVRVCAARAIRRWRAARYPAFRRDHGGIERQPRFDGKLVAGGSYPARSSKSGSPSVDRADPVAAGAHERIERRAVDTHPLISRPALAGCPLCA
jgi:hypothetical protein